MTLIILPFDIEIHILFKFNVVFLFVINFDLFKRTFANFMVIIVALLARYRDTICIVLFVHC